MNFKFKPTFGIRTKIFLKINLSAIGWQAETFDEFVGKFPVLALKGAKVSDFGGM